MSARTVLGLLVLVGAPGLARAERPEGVCVEVSVDFTPAPGLQIVAWLETPSGEYLDTIYITQKTGRYGMGNRPGRADFNTGSPLGDVFPYGRRIQTFPVWAHRHGLEFPQVVFQNGDENNLSHPFSDSSPEAPPPYCRPIQPMEPEFDAGTCASEAFTDKGQLSSELTTPYPPRADLMRVVGTDSASVEMYRAFDPFDAVSAATPPGNLSASAHWAAPQRIDYGDYVLFVETSKTYDFNATYNQSVYPAPTDIPWKEYGKPWRGQPSVIYRVPFTIATTPTVATTDQFAGHGDPSGQTGTLFPDDGTIEKTTPGSGASRMQLVSDDGTMYRLRVRAVEELDSIPPAPVGSPIPTQIGSRSATIAFEPSGDDGLDGVATGYEVRVRAGSPITDDNFLASTPVPAQVVLDDTGNPTIELSGLLPETEYYVGVRPYDNCFNRGAVVSTQFTTHDRDVAEVDWCFVATAAYGSAMATDVELLRHFRDSFLGSSVLGQLAVSTYYTFGPAVAGIVGQSELLRASARAVLAPVVQAVRRVAY